MAGNGRYQVPTLAMVGQVLAGRNDAMTLKQENRGDVSGQCDRCVRDLWSILGIYLESLAIRSTRKWSNCTGKPGHLIGGVAAGLHAIEKLMHDA